MSGRSSTSVRAMNGPHNADRLIDEFRSPAAVALSGFFIIIDLKDPTNRNAHDRPRNSWVTRNRGKVPITVKERKAIDERIRPVPTDFMGLMRSPTKYIATNCVKALVARTNHI